jgi:MoaA/NifB/PqqE/SkfB family radical SAM enzyme
VTAASWTPSARLKKIAMERAQPLSASLELTYRCNWRCVFCYNPRHHDHRRLTGEEWRRVLDDLRALGTLYVALTGGEPLTHPDFFAIARGVRERALALRILTNGALITETAADAMAALRPIAVEMSLHGARAETHDRATATPGSFDALLRGTDRLLGRGVSVVLKTPLTRLNEDEIEPMRALTERRRVPWRADPVLTPRDDGDRGPLAYRASAAAIERLYRRLADAGQLPREERVRGGVNCGLGRTTLAVDPEGNVFPCMQWRRTPLGNVRATPLRELWPASPARREAAAVAVAANDLLVDAGGALARFPFCPALAHQRTGDPLRPDEGHREQAEMARRLRPSAG